MKFYSTINPDGKVQFVATQLDVKKLKQQIQPVEVPTDSKGLMDYINKLLLLADPLADVPEREDLSEQTENVEENVPEREEPLFIKSPKGGYDMPNPKHPNSGQRLLQEGRELDQIAEWIMELDGWRLTKLVDAVLERMRELAKQLKEGLTK